MPTPVAYGCHLTSTIDYVHFIALLPINREGRVIVTSAKSKDITRGNSPITTLMRNCGIMCLEIVEGETRITSTVKVFKQYLHFCRVNEEQANILADFTCSLLREIQEVIEDEKRRWDWIQTLDHLRDEGERKATFDYFGRNNVCASDVSHTEVVSTMINHAINIGSKIHTSSLARLLLKKKDARWVVTYDNALSLAVRVKVLDDSGKDGHVFTIHPSGNVLYSARNSDEIEDSKDSLVRFLHNNLDLIEIK
jgi:hypothetical protein